MPTYAYSVRDAAGVLRNGTSEAENPDVLARRLREQGFVISEIKQSKAKRAGGGSFLDNLQKIKLTELSIMCRQFSTMVDAGVSLVRCLSVLGEQTANARLRRILLEIQKEVEAGQSLSRSMGKYPNVFNNLFIGLVRAGEVGGVLEETLQRLSTFLEKDVELRRKVKSALTYPTIVVIAAVGIVVGLCTFVVPKFIQLFKDLGVKEFPALTLGLMAFSNFLTGKWYWCIAIFVVSRIALTAFVKTKFGRYAFDRLMIKMPVFGPLNHKVALARFARTLGTLLVSGVPILQALETVSGTVSNVVMSDAIMEARARIREGDRIGDPLVKSKLFPPMVIHMISIGEESGSLDAMLGKIADFYEDEVDAALASLAAAIEPLLICFLGVAVLLIVLGMFMPMVSLIQNLSGSGDDDKGGGD
ncbi:pilus biosynthesis protein PilC [Capsulimonas corticalis]|uniref:Pilus biosynthesis protein PilC n=1 Tax=Capsulimonas corticalis TaxID=2219043 RepID=A0A402CPK1_9BACT|nr:type II secretion system F family protein [Capsulimonas corticalis]BDI32974.1 pilus biosynthesis protein PilC [Capsulimonas corticalis]